MTRPPDRPIKILYIVPTADLYGISKVILDLAANLPAGKFTPIVALPYAGSLQAELDRRGVQNLVLPMAVVRRGALNGLGLLRLLLSFPSGVLVAVRFIRRNEVDVVHTNGAVILTGAVAAWICQIPHIWHIHENIRDEFASLWRFFHRLVTATSRKVVCVSEGTAGQFPDRRKIQVIYNGIAISRDSVTPKDPSEPWEEQGETLKIGMIGRISPRKGQAVLLEAYARCRQKNHLPPSHLYLFGDTFPGYEAYQQSLYEQTRTLGLEGQVTFAGFRPDIQRIYPHLDLVVFPSILPEGFPMVVMEALAACRPVIASAAGGPVEIIEPGVSGILVPPGDIKALEEALADLIASPDERRRLGEGGYRRLQAEFTREKMIRQFVELYESL